MVQYGVETSEMRVLRSLVKMKNVDACKFPYLVEMFKTVNIKFINVSQSPTPFRGHDIPQSTNFSTR